MLWRWFRIAMQRAGIHLPFTGVICVEGTQTIEIDEEWRARITTRQKLVFLEPPSAGDLRDTFGLDSGDPAHSGVYTSSDAIVLGREDIRGCAAYYWWPHDSIPLYTLYEHAHGWTATGMVNRSALCVEYRCDMRTGAFTIECLVSAPFEAAVVFKRPRWRRLTERALIASALKQLQSSAEGARILEDGGRLRCDIRGPGVGERYIFVAFRKCGVADCERWLEDTSMLGRARRLVGRWASA